MNSFDDKLKAHFGNKLPEGEELYTNENLKSIENGPEVSHLADNIHQTTKVIDLDPS